MYPSCGPVTPDRPPSVREQAQEPIFPRVPGAVLCGTPLRPRHPLNGMSDPARARTVGSEWTKTEAADEAAAEAITDARVKCTTRHARIVAKPPRSRSNRTRQRQTTAENFS